MAILWKLGVGPRDRASIALFVAGTCAPDLLGQVPGLALIRARFYLPWIPEPLVYLWSPLHLPVGMVLMSYALAHLFEPAWRARAFRGLLGGGLLHLGVDLLQSHFGVGYMLFFPLSRWDWELGLIGSEDTVRIAPVLVVVTALLLGWHGKRAAARIVPAGDKPIQTPASRSPER